MPTLLSGRALKVKTIRVPVSTLSALPESNVGLRLIPTNIIVHTVGYRNLLVLSTTSPLGLKCYGGRLSHEHKLCVAPSLSAPHPDLPCLILPTWLTVDPTMPLGEGA